MFKKCFSLAYKTQIKIWTVYYTATKKTNYQFLLQWFFKYVSRSLLLKCVIIKFYVRLNFIKGSALGDMTFAFHLDDEISKKPLLRLNFISAHHKIVRTYER